MAHCYKDGDTSLRTYAHTPLHTHTITTQKPVEYLHKKGLQLTNIGSADVVDSNEKLLLGLMWTIILRFAVAEDGKQGACRIVHVCVCKYVHVWVGDDGC